MAAMCPTRSKLLLPETINCKYTSNMSKSIKLICQYN